MGTKTGPASTMVPPHPQAAVARAPDQDFVLKRMEDEAKIKAYNQKKADEIAVYLDTNYCRYDMTWPFLQTAPGYQLRVSRFYPVIKVAVDLFPMADLGKAEIKEVEFKRKVFKANGIRYGALTHSSKLEDLTPQIGLI